MQTLLSRDDLPEPIAGPDMGRVWSFADVPPWAERTARVAHPAAGR